MLWFTVWAVLVLATLGGAFLLGRSLWRKFKALLAELRRASAVAQALADRADELAAARTPADSSHELFTDRATLAARWATVRDEGARRRRSRRTRHERTAAGWRAYTR